MKNSNTSIIVLMLEQRNCRMNWLPTRAKTSGIISRAVVRRAKSYI
jgi:hypothetical protein